MVRRRYRYLLRLSSKLSVDLNNIVAWARSNKSRVDVKAEALAKAEKRLKKYLDLLIPYVWRSRVKRDLVNPTQLSSADVAQLQKTCDRYLNDFKGILNDVI